MADLHQCVRNAIETGEFYPNYNTPIEILKLFYRWLIVGGEDEAAEEVSRLIRKYGGTV